MPRLTDNDKRAKLSALKKMKNSSFLGKIFGFGPSGEEVEGVDPDKKAPWQDCVNRDGSMCKPDKMPEEGPKPPKDDEDDDDKE